MRARAEAIVFDVDGVLLDTRPSFTACVLQTAAEVGGLGPEWGEAGVERLRLAGGFNNDWDLTAALALLAPLSAPGLAWDSLCERLAADGGGARSVSLSVGDAMWAGMRARVERPFQRRYAGWRAPEVYGVEAGEGEGRCSLERALVPRGFFESLGLPFGLFTGRCEGELALALERLEVDVPRERVVWDEGVRWRKPNPDGLLRLAERLGAARLVFVGDSVDDQEAARRASESGVETAFAGIAPQSSDKARRFLARGAALVADDVAAAVEGLRSRGLV